MHNCYIGPCGEGPDEYGPIITAEAASATMPGWSMVFENPDTQWIRMNGREITCGIERDGLRSIRQFRLRDGAQRVSGANSVKRVSSWIWSNWSI